MVQKDRPNVINIGTYTRVCHVVQNGSLSLAELCKMVLKVNLDKNADVRLSDWNAPKLTPSQMKYATLDAIFSLTIFLELDKIPDLTRRYTMKDVKNKEGTIVDSVPIHGSVACMATRAAAVRIITDTECNSPDGISPKLVRPGAVSVAIEFINIYSTGPKLPSYSHIPSKSEATISYFQNACAVEPVNMLREHVESEYVRPTPTENDGNSESVVSLPTVDKEPTASVEKRDAGDVILEKENEYSDENLASYNDLTEEEMDDDIGNITSSYIEIIRNAIEESSNAIAK